MRDPLYPPLETLAPTEVKQRWRREKSCIEINGMKFAAKERAKQRREDLRKRVIAAYGGICKCCGESDPYFLTLDHIFNDGYRSRDGDAYSFVEEHGYPRDRFQLLCWNCNCAKGIHGVCPHNIEFRANMFINEFPAMRAASRQ